MSFLSMDLSKPYHISVSSNHMIRINIGIYDRIVIYSGDPRPPDGLLAAKAHRAICLSLTTP